MKIKLIPSIIAAAIGFVATQSAFAIDGTIDFTGEITANTCTVKIDENANGSGTVTLPSVSVASLPTTGSVAGATLFDISLSDCTITSGTTVSSHFEPGAYTGSDGRLLQSHSSGANNVELQLLNSQLGVINAAAGVGKQNDTGVAMSIGETSAKLTYYVQYYATGVVSAGPVTSQVSYSIVYD